MSEIEELAERLKAKLALEEENREKKRQMLRELGTGKLLAAIPELEEKLEQALREEASFKNLNVGFLASQGSDCPEAKRILAELTVKGPPPSETKLTAAERDAWLTLQRTENRELETTLARQKDVAFQLENFRVTADMAKKKLENIHRVLALRTAQIEFLTEYKI